MNKSPVCEAQLHSPLCPEWCCDRPRDYAHYATLATLIFQFDDRRDK